jgi:hypothetical protein
VSAIGVHVLSFHADYQCRHSGRCCTSNWPIPVETSLVDHLAGAVHTGTLRAAGTGPWYDNSDSGVLLGRAQGRCVFYTTAPSGGCAIHTALGSTCLPEACRQFPRQSVRDPRGASVTLSHYCPTAASMLVGDDDGPVAIRVDAPAFPADADYTGFDADPDIPPMLRDDCLMDWDSWWHTEARAIDLLTAHPESGLPRLGCAIEQLRRWRPGSIALRASVDEAFDGAHCADVTTWLPSPELVQSRTMDILEAVPAPWRAEAEQAVAQRAPAPVARVRSRFLAAHAFANWTAYGGQGLRAWYRSVEASACLLWMTGDAGRVDLVVRHLADSSALIARWNRAELEPVYSSPING